MKSFISYFLFIVMTMGCSQTYRNRSDISGQQKNLDDFIIMDSSIVLATVKPIDYIWNTDTTLIDLIRKRFAQPIGEHKYPNPFSPFGRRSRACVGKTLVRRGRP